ncbi:MAG: hypothetical protein B0D92_04445 [Spirochaeta sp. LUC14_002_19_P3]|nr:MAG: hypothetical protein B0D92_04445 [Spirochaeta sp. LUC14_002_19_P3]
MSNKKTSLLKEFRTLKPYLRHYRWAYLIGFAFLIITDAGQIVIPRIVGAVVDGIAAGNAENILRWLLSIILLAIFVALGRYGWRIFIIGSARRIESELRSRMYEKFLTLSQSFYMNHKTGDSMARVTNDLDSVRMAVGMGTIALIDGVFMTLVIIGTLFFSYGVLGLVVVVPLPLLTVFALFFGRLIGPLFMKVQERYSGISEYLQETLTGIRVIKSFVMEKKVHGDFAKVNDAYAQANMNLVRFWGMLFPAMGFLAGLGVLFLLYFGGTEVLNGHLSAGDFIAMLSYLGMLIWPAMGAGWVVNMMQRGAASMKRINDILDTQADIIDLPGAVSLPFKGGLECRSVSYRYGDAVVLADVNFSVPEGDSLGILGRTGSGKTTLVKLITRIIDPPEASIFIGGSDIRSHTRSALRRSLGVVPQDVFLFSETIRANIVYARPQADSHEVNAAVKIAGLEADLPFFPKGLDTIVGEKGVTLSGGQKQRIAIARAIITAPEILILDDALSAVDADTEERILKGLFEFRGGGTTVMISHRVSALARCDNCLTLEDGRVTTHGTHEELIAAEGFYREIFNLQKLERKAEHAQ